MPDAPHPVSPAAKTFVAGRVVGDYEIIGELGRGGMGVVYRARQITLNRVVGLKMLSGHYGPEELTRFLAEAETAAGLHHTNIVQIYEVGDFDGAPFYSMEFVESGSLADRLRKEPMENREAAQLLISVARALHFAHRNHVVHRDMKPANILLDPDGVPKVADFGIAKRLTANAALTLSGAVIGTPTYMAPEQAKGTSRDVGAPADVYSLGAILYEMLAGRPPFLPDESDTALTFRVITEDPVSPAFYRPGIPRDLETICLKCLEKEPRDRYESAAAFAEDLRRYVDDESIVARPPTTVVRTAKWIRRNPWRFVAAAALILAVAWGAQRLWHWEFYERPHLEYAAAVDFVNGVLEPAVKLEPKDLSRSAVHLRLTRSGRSGSITLVEVLNARGHPAVLRPVQNPEVIPVYMEGLLGAQPNTEKSSESTKVEFLYTEGKLGEVRARDRNGGVTWRVLYDRDVAEDSAATVRARYVNVQGFNAASQTAATRFAAQRDPQGRDVKISFFNSIGEPTPNGEGVYGYKIERDGAGRMTSVTNLDRQGKAVANRVGAIAVALKWNREGRLSRVEFLDREGRAAPFNGVAATTIEYDPAGNAIRHTLWGEDGKVARTTGTSWAVQEIARNERGEVVGRKYFRGEADSGTALISEWTIAYDEFGHPADLRIAGAVNWRTAFRHDASGNVIEEKYLDAEGRPVAGENGYAIRKRVYEFSPQGSRWIETFFDASGAKTYGKRDYHRLITEFGPTGVLQRTMFEEFPPGKYRYHRDVSIAEYDAEGNLRRNITRREDENGQLAVNAGLPYTMLEESFDAQGRSYLKWYIGCPESEGAPVFSFDTEYHRNGARKRIVRQAYDSERKPVPYLSTTGLGARLEEDYDMTTNQVERSTETGFNENVVGFNVREAKYSNATLVGVTHKRSDGSVVEAVRAVITEVTPAQPKAAELKIGDQILEVNGKPVPSTFHFDFQNFPGGWLEVLRDGQRLRMEGFVAGPIGMSLEDRAVANP
jgi:Protein kinase domain/PDZ domain